VGSGKSKVESTGEAETNLNLFNPQFFLDFLLSIHFVVLYSAFLVFPELVNIEVSSFAS